MVRTESDRIPSEHELAVSVPEAARLLGISRAGAYRHLPLVRIGKRCVVPRHALKRLLEEGRHGPP